MTPARADLAAAHLRGKVEASAFVDSERLAVIGGLAPLHARSSRDSGMVTELLYGEAVQAYERKDGWIWLQAERDGYVGYADARFFAAPLLPTHRISAVLTPLLSRPDVKGRLLQRLPMNAAVRVEDEQGPFVRIAPAGYAYAAHLTTLSQTEADFVAAAERFIGVPYIWGGKTWLGLDCSGLIQTALHAAGQNCPRDSDMQEASLGTPLQIAPDKTGYRRGDLVFWKTHVGIMRDTQTLLHANAHHMAVASEPLAEAAARIEKTAGPIRTVKRLGSAIIFDDPA